MCLQQGAIARPYKLDVRTFREAENWIKKEETG